MSNQVAAVLNDSRQALQGSNHGSGGSLGVKAKERHFRIDSGVRWIVLFRQIFATLLCHAPICLHSSLAKLSRTLSKSGRAMIWMSAISIVPPLGLVIPTTATLLALTCIGYSGVMSTCAIENVFGQSCDSFSTPKRFRCAAALPLNQATHFGAGTCDVISIAHRQAVVIQHPQ